MQSDGQDSRKAKDVGRHSRSIIEHEHISFILASLPRLAEIHSYFRRSPLDGVVDVLTQRGGRVAVADVAQRAD